MDINNNQQINTFLKGMNTDVSDALIDSSQYRYAENLRLVTNTDSNSGELRLVDGTDVFSPGNPYNKGAIKAMTSVRDLLIVVNLNDEIWVQDTSGTTYGDSQWKQVYRPGESEDDAFGDYLSLVCRWETDTLIKLYIADAKHQLMYINIAPDANHELNTISGVNNILADAEVLLPPIKASISESSGTIPPVKVQYVYRMYKMGGAATTLSVTSNVITLYKTTNEGYTETDNQTNKAVDLVIPQINVDQLDYLLIYRINYRLIGQLPEVSLIYDDKAVQSFVDRGVNVETISLADLLSMIKLNIVPTVIESKNDYLFAANIRYKTNELDKTLTNNWEDVSIARSYSKGDFLDLNVPNCDPSEYKNYALPYNTQFDSDNIMSYDSKYWGGGVGEYISWRFVYRPVFVDITNQIFEDRTKTTPIKEQVLSLQYGEVYRYGAVFYDNKGQKSSVFWIADIMAPKQGDEMAEYPALYGKYGDGNDGYDPTYSIPTVGIRFIVNKFPEGISGIEIVRCQRTVSDMLTITLGMVGLPYRIYTKTKLEGGTYEDTEMVCPTGLMVSNRFYANGTLASDDDNRNRSIAYTDPNVLMFSSPEYVYQPDDIQNLIKEHKNNLVLQILYNGYSDSESVEAYDGESDKDYIRVKSYNTASDHSFWYRYADDSERVPLSMNRGTLVYDELTANVNYSPTYGRGKMIYELDYGTIGRDNSVFVQDVREPILLLEMPLEISAGSNEQYSIVNYGFPNVPDWNQFFDDLDSARWEDDLSSVGTGTQYVPWSVPLLNGSTSGNGGGLMKVDDGWGYDNIGTRYPSYYPVGSTGKCIVMNIDKPFTIYTGNKFCTPIINIRKKNVPYGGNHTIDYSSYLSYGNFVQEHVYPNGSAEYYVDVFDGDVHPGVFTYNASHAWFDANTAYGARYVSIYYMPCLSAIDLKATCGDLYPNLTSAKKYYVQDKASAVSDRFTQAKDAYLYNTAYGSEPTAIENVSLKHTEIDTNKYDTRVHHSELKTNGEHIDNWLNFRAMNFIDVDSRFGEITNMRLFKDRLLYWLDNATGVLSVNERTIVNDMDDNKIILGTGDVLQRYDYISTLYGMKPFLYEAEVQSNTTQYWWDGHNKEILGYGGGMELVPLAKIKNVTNYINGNNEIEHPSLSYDIKFNELMSSVVDNNTLTYNEQVQLFTSTYTFNPIYRTIINNELLLTNDNTVYKWNGGNGEVSTLFGSAAHPLVLYVVNNQNVYVKVFDISTFGGRLYGGDEGINNLTFTFKTPLKLRSTGTGSSLITNREYDFRLDIPRNNDSSYGDRMRGKTMQCELKSSSNSTDFSLQYIVTKYRMSWS